MMVVSEACLIYQEASANLESREFSYVSLYGERDVVKVKAISVP
jgi:hypothetical protein